MVQYDIIDGPSKFDLMLSLFDTNNLITRMVTFKVVNLPRLCKPAIADQVCIDRLERSRQEEDLWAFSGFRIADEERKTNNHINIHYEGMYSTRKRRGYMEMNIV